MRESWSRSNDQPGNHKYMYNSWCLAGRDHPNTAFHKGLVMVCISPAGIENIRTCQEPRLTCDDIGTSKLHFILYYTKYKDDSKTASYTLWALKPFKIKKSFVDLWTRQWFVILLSISNRIWWQCNYLPWSTMENWFDHQRECKFAPKTKNVRNSHKIIYKRCLCSITKLDFMQSQWLFCVIPCWFLIS